MKRSKMKREKAEEIFFHLVYALLVLITLPFFVSGDASTSSSICTDPQTFDQCYKENPSYANLLLSSSPSLDQFQLLKETDSSQAALYLTARYNEEFAADYISSTDVTHADPIQSLVAERFFSEDADHVQDYKAKFQDYMGSKGISIDMKGDIQGYKSDGTIVADNGQINVKDFGTTYSFVVNDDDELVLVPKGSTKQYEFEGTVTENSNGQLQINGEGSFDGLDVKNAEYIKIGKEGNTVIGAEQYGDLKCQTLCHMTYNPNERTYQVKDAVLADYPDFKVTGTLRLDEKYYGLSTTYTVPAGKKLEVQPIVSDPTQQEIADQGYRVLANGGKDVQIALEDDTWLDHPADFVLQYLGETAVSVGLATEEGVAAAKRSFEETYQEAVEAGYAPETKKDKVRLDSEGTVYLESTDAAAEDPASYRMEVDMGAMYTAEQQERQLYEQSVDFIPPADKGFYEKGDYKELGTDEYDAVTQIQTIVGAKVDGKYGKKTEQAVSSWENNYNEKYGLTPDNDAYLDPDGIWDERNTIGYLRMTKQEEPTIPAFAVDMRGGEAVVDLSSGGFDVTQTGAMDIEVEGITFRYDAEGKTDKELQQLVKNDMSIPITITSCNEVSTSTDVVGSAISPAGSGTVCNRFTNTETEYGLDSLSEGFASGRISASCPLFSGIAYDPSSASCSSHVTAVAQIEGGEYSVYGRGEAFVVETGQRGSTWEFPHNIIAAGGKSINIKDKGYPAGDPRLAERVSYDQSKLKAGDKVTMYYTKSNYLDEAAACICDGEPCYVSCDGRKATHIVAVVSKPHEAYTYSGDGTSAASYIQEQLDVDKMYLDGYPVWIESKKATYSDGEFYYTDAQGKPTGEPIVLQSGDRVDVQKTLISHLYHDPENPDASPTRLEDYGYFLSHNEDFSYYEHLRPNQQKYAEAEEKASGTVRVEVFSEEDLTDAIASQGIPLSHRDTALAYIKEINGIPQEGGFEAGDVIMIPSSQQYQERYAASLQEKLEGVGVAETDSAALTTTIMTSARARAEEYDISDAEIDDFAEATATIAYYQKGFISEEEWQMNFYIENPTSDEGWRETKRNEFAREQYAAYLERDTGITPETVSYGYLDTQDATAEANARELYEAGKIAEVDYHDPTDMLSYEGSFKNGGREVAKLWSRYTDPDRPYEENLALVGFGYNRGEDAPALLAAQYQFEEVGYPIETKGGQYTEETLTTMNKYAEDHDISFDKEQTKKEIEDRTFDFDSSPVIIAMKQEYQEKTGEEPVYSRLPQVDEYVHTSSGWDLMEACQWITPVEGRCAVQTDQS